MTLLSDPAALNRADIARWFASTALVLAVVIFGALLPSRITPIIVSADAPIDGIEVVFEGPDVSPRAGDGLVLQAPPASAPEIPPEPQQAGPDEVRPPEYVESGEQAEPEPEAEPAAPEGVPQLDLPVAAPPDIKPEMGSLDDVPPAARQVMVAMPAMRPPDLAAPRPQRTTTSPPRPQPGPTATPAQATPAPASASALPAAQTPTAAQEATWQSRVLAHLNRQKTYPRAAQRNRATGAVVMRFTLNAEGSLVSSSVVQSSGEPILDQAAISLVHSASPFPAPPSGISASKLTLRVPIEYQMR